MILSIIWFWCTVISIPMSIVLALTVPPAISRRSWRFFLRALPLALAGIVLPLFVYFWSSLLVVPYGKNECLLGWIDCFSLGKLCLAPLVLWACAAFYWVVVLKNLGVDKRWVVLGFFSGAVASSIMLIHGLIFSSACWNYGLAGGMGFGPWFVLWLLVPIYVAVWYTWLAVRLIKRADFNRRTYLKNMLHSLPLYFVGMLVSNLYYRSIPSSYRGGGSCFVVTAAMRGHRSLVGPFYEIEPGHSVQKANRQLIVFWLFEEIWQRKYPRAHRIFRYVYNFIGPLVASLIRFRTVADMMYLLLKPFELIATAVIRLSNK